MGAKMVRLLAVEEDGGTNLYTLSGRLVVKGVDLNIGSPKPVRTPVASRVMAHTPSEMEGDEEDELEFYEKGGVAAVLDRYKSRLK